MYLNSISIVGFRSFLQEKSYDFSPELTIIHGPNSVGKTNLLEAIYLLNQGQGFRGKKTEELIHLQKHEGLVKGELVNTQEKIQIKTRLVKKPTLTEKQFFVNEHLKNLRDYRRSSLPIVLFQPHDLIMITSAPEKRRTYFDQLLMQADYEYFQAKHNYEKGLRRRNKLLEQHRKYKKIDFTDMLEFWNNYLVENANIITKGRQKITDFFNQYPELNGIIYQLKYQANQFQKNALLNKELRWHRTLSGPQLDNFLVLKKDVAEWKDLALYGSRSEQRLVIIWFKTNELRYYEQKLKSKPILLMDDIFSELDQANTKRVTKIISGYQSFLTTAYPDSVKKAQIKGKMIEP